MNNSQAFDFTELKKMSVNELIEKCKGYVEHYVSSEAGDQFEQAYQSKNYDKLMQLLAEAQKKAEAGIKCADLEKARDIITQELSEAEALFDDTVKNEGNNNMAELVGEISNKIGNWVSDYWPFALVVILITMSVVACMKWNKSKKAANEKTVNHSRNKGKRTVNKNVPPKYTKEDRDMLELIHQLSIIYQNTDEYLK